MNTINKVLGLKPSGLLAPIVGAAQDLARTMKRAKQKPLRVDNATNWRTDDLRALIAAALEADGIGAAGMNVRVVRARQQGGCSGYAWYHSRSMVVRVPSENKRDPFLGDVLAVRVTLPEKWRDDLARVVMHEAAHCRGVHHAEMHGSLRRTHQARHCTDDRDVAFAAQFQIRLQRPKQKAARNVVAERAEHAAKMLAKSERKLKLARTLASKWRAKVRYYERRAAAAVSS